MHSTTGLRATFEIRPLREAKNQQQMCKSEFLEHFYFKNGSSVDAITVQAVLALHVSTAYDVANDRTWCRHCRHISHFGHFGAMDEDPQLWRRMQVRTGDAMRTVSQLYTRVRIHSRL